MPLAGKEVDANFFNLIHRVLVEQRQKSARNRRDTDRTSYAALARIALPRGRTIPPEEEFFEVRCCDLTRRGFSFLLPYQPSFAELIACFGTPPEAIYLGAHVAHCAEVTVRANGQIDHGENGRGKPMFLVGCQFTERRRRPVDDHRNVARRS